MAKRKAAATRKKRPARARSTAKSARRKSTARKAASRAGKASRASKASRTSKATRASGASSASRARKPRRAAKVRRASAARARTGATRPKSPVVKAARRPTRATPSVKATAAREASRNVLLRKPPGLDRERRTIQDDDIVPTPPSSLDLDRSASAARTGRRELRERLDEHTETSPALTAGDVDADWESAYSVGDEAPGGDNPTPDQDVVDDIGRAVGVQYEDNEELKGEAKIAKRDKHRWELDPASSEDFNER